MAVTTGQLAKQLESSAIVSAAELSEMRQQSGLTDDSAAGDKLAKLLVKQGKLTKFQAQLAYSGKAKNLVMGSYVIQEKLGEGGMGQVYKARHRRMKRDVALKVLAPQYVKDEAALKRFHREVEAAARLQHPNVVTAYDADEVRGTHYLVMEYVRGDDLSVLVKKSGPVPTAQAVDYILQAARGLAFAHSEGVVHRDIKPSNLLLNDKGRVKILDMGLARFDGPGADNAEAAALTGTGMLMGTVDYMAPEQAMDSKTADHRADIYSLGCTLYFLLTGQPVYSEDTMMKRIMAHQNAAIPQLPIADAELQQLFERMVAKKAADRAETTDVVGVLESWLQRNSADATVASDASGEHQSSTLQAAETLLPTAGTDPAASDTHPSAFDATMVPSESKPGDAGAVVENPVPTNAAPAIDLSVEPEPVRRRNRRSSSKRKRREQTGRGGGRNRKLLLGALGGLAGVVLLGVILFKFRSQDGTVVVELDTDVEIAAVEIDGNTVSFSPDGSNKQLTFEVDPGSHELTLTTTDGVELVTSLGEKPLEIKAGGNATLSAWVEKTPKPSAVGDVDREVAEWVLSLPANLQIKRHVVVKIGGETRTVKTASALPDQPFTVYCVYIIGVDGKLLTSERFRQICQLPSLNLFVVAQLTSAANITDEEIAYLSTSPLGQSGNLMHLMIQSAGVTDDAIEALNRLTSLKSLGLRQTGVTADGLSRLELQELAGIQLEEGTTTLSFLRRWQQTKPNLSELTLSRSHEPITAEHFELLRHWEQQLRLLRFCQSGLTDQSVAAFAEMTDFSGSLDISFNSVTDKGIANLERLTKLKSIDVRATDVTEAGVRKLQQALPNCKITSDFGEFGPGEALIPAPSATQLPPPNNDAASNATDNTPQNTDMQAAERPVDAANEEPTAASKDVLAPLPLRIRERDKGLPKFQNTLRPGQPLGEFAAVSNPASVKDIISWSIEPVLHRGGFRSIDIRDDGLMATGGHDGAIRIWTSDWQLIKVLPGHANSINSVQFSPDGTMLASVSAGPRDMLAVWDVDSGQLLKFHDVGNWQGHLAWLPDNATILHCGRPDLEAIDALTGERTAIGDKLDSTMIALSPGGKRFAVLNGGKLWVFETDGYKLLRQMDVKAGSSVDWSNDGKSIAVGTSYETIIYDTRSFQRRHSLDAIGHVRFSPDSTKLAVSANGRLSVLRTSDWQRQFADGGGVGAYEFAWTPDSASLVTQTSFINAETGQRRLSQWQQAIPRVAKAVTADGSRVATATRNRLRIWDAEQGGLANEFSIPERVSYQLLWQPQGNLLLRVNRDEEDNPDRLTLIDSTSGRTIHQLIGHREQIWWACWSPDGKQVASVGDDGLCRIWNAATGDEVRSLTHDDPLWWVVWAPDGSKIATGSAFSTITVWDARDGGKLREFKTLSEPLKTPTLQRAADTPFCFLKNSNQIFYMADFSGFEMLDVKSGQITSLGRASIRGGDRLSIGWSPDFTMMGLYCGYGEFHLIRQGEDKSFDVRYFTSPHWLSDSKRVLGGDNLKAWVAGYDIRRRRRIGVLFPELPDDAWAVLSRQGYVKGSSNLEDNVVVVAMHEDGRLLTLTLTEFKEQFGWKNDEDAVRILSW